MNTYEDLWNMFSDHENTKIYFEGFEISNETIENTMKMIGIDIKIQPDKVIINGEEYIKKKEEENANETNEQQEPEIIRGNWKYTFDKDCFEDMSDKIAYINKRYFYEIVKAKNYDILVLYVFEKSIILEKEVSKIYINDDLVFEEFGFDYVISDIEKLEDGYKIYITLQPIEYKIEVS